MDQLLQHIKGMVPLSDRESSLITERLEEQRFVKKEHLLRANDRVDGVYFIRSGCVRTYVLDYNGVEHNISFSMENWWFGDLQCFLNQTPAAHNIQALEDLTVLSINRPGWDELIAEVPSFVNYTRVLFRNTMFAHENRILQNLSYTAEERYDCFLKQYPTLPQRISQKHIASYLGITPEFLSMLRSKRKG